MVQIYIYPLCSLGFIQARAPSRVPFLSYFLTFSLRFVNFASDIINIEVFIVTNFNLCDIFNVNGTSLFFFLLSFQGLSLFSLSFLGLHLLKHALLLLFDQLALLTVSFRFFFLDRDVGFLFFFLCFFFVVLFSFSRSKLKKVRHWFLGHRL